MKNVRDILRTKADQQLYNVTPSTTVLEALKLMAAKEIGALVVVENDKLVGILSERDYARKVALMERSSRTTEVREIMTNKVMCVSPSESIEYCMTTMTEHRLRHLPVLEEGKLIGLISIGDLVKNIISNQQDMIRHLEQYIRGEIA